jgi:hypothetical protein
LYFIYFISVEEKKMELEKIDDGPHKGEALMNGMYKRAGEIIMIGGNRNVCI